MGNTSAKRSHESTKESLLSGDLEAGDGGQARLYPTMTEDPALRWTFIRKVYMILSLQLLVTMSLVSVFVLIPEISQAMLFVRNGFPDFVFLVFLLLLYLAVQLETYHKHHPKNLFLLAAFTVTTAFIVGLSCSFSKAKVVLLAGTLTSVAVISLTIYTFWAAKKGYDFEFLGPFLSTSLLILIIFGFLQMFIPMESLTMLYGCMGAMVYSGYIIYDTDKLIKRLNYDDHILACACLYLKIINLFLSVKDAMGRGNDASNS